MTQFRKDKLENNCYYHVFSRSIAKYVVFNDDEDYSRFTEIIDLYRHANFNYQYSKFTRMNIMEQMEILISISKEKDYLVENIAFCLMPTHIHFLIKQKADQGISKFMGKILNCYSRYFNIKHKRTGPLWSSRFKSVLVKTDEQLLHLTRYIHLNPTSIGLVDKPEDWHYSSYNYYLDDKDNMLLKYSNLFPVSPKEYKKFVMNRKDYQQDLSKIKSLIMEDYTG